MNNEQPEHGETVRGPITGMPVTMPPQPRPRSKVRVVLGGLMAVISTLLTLIAFTSPTTRTLLEGNLARFAGWFVGTLIVAGIPWVITGWLLRKPSAPKAAQPRGSDADTPRPNRHGTFD